MRTLSVLAGLFFGPSLLADQPQTTKVIGPAEAIKLAKEAQVTVEFEVEIGGNVEGKRALVAQ